MNKMWKKFKAYIEPRHEYVIEPNPELDMIYVHMGPGAVARTVSVEATVDIDIYGNIVGIELSDLGEIEE